MACSAFIFWRVIGPMLGFRVTTFLRRGLPPGLAPYESRLRPLAAAWKDVGEAAKCAIRELAVEHRNVHATVFVPRRIEGEHVERID